MQMTSALCRAQEAYHDQLATSTLLENVRTVALRAASAWGMEAASAERREERYALRIVSVATTRDRELSENPDRGCADISVSKAISA